VHASPADAVEIFKDVRAKRALAMHWGGCSTRALPDTLPLTYSRTGTWTLTGEPIMEPPAKLREACTNAGFEEGMFDVCRLGETRVF
jgi:N-acyl-phosphatidylethanolamine-hydrolysing phospholipase D